MCQSIPRWALTCRGNTTASTGQKNLKWNSRAKIIKKLGDVSHNFSQAWQTSQVRDTFSWGKRLLQSQHFSQAVRWRQRRHRSDSLGITASYLCPNNFFFSSLTLSSIITSSFSPTEQEEKEQKGDSAFDEGQRARCRVCFVSGWMCVSVSDVQWGSWQVRHWTLSLFVLQTDQPYRPLLYNIWLAPTLTLVALLSTFSFKTF